MKRSFTNKENYGSSIALTILMLLLFLWLNTVVFIYCAIAILFVAALNVKWIYPVSFVWYNLAMLMSKVTTTVLLSVVFVFLVCPAGFVRRMLQKDSLRLADFKKSNESVFVERKHTFSSNDLLKPY